MQNNYKSNRLLISLLDQEDAEFIFELLNTEGWKKFIGDRKIHSGKDAQQYIQKITDNPKTNFWVAKSKDEKLGVISFIKRDYLDHHDIGFAFLPNFSRKGFAFEAVVTVLNDLLQDPDHQTILATTMMDNLNSIKLLEKLGFQCMKEIENEGTKLLLYSISKN
jgi:RimJ/RimL family protein N-acetyltransferase